MRKQTLNQNAKNTGQTGVNIRRNIIELGVIQNTYRNHTRIEATTNEMKKNLILFHTLFNLSSQK